MCVYCRTTDTRVLSGSETLFYEVHIRILRSKDIFS